MPKQRRNLRRIIRKFAMFVLLGAIVNVAVAWRIACLVVVNSNIVRLGQTTTDLPKWHYEFSIPQAAGSLRVWSFVTRQDGPDQTMYPTDPEIVTNWTRLTRTPSDQDMQTRDRWIEDGRGWPLLAMYCRWTRPFDLSADYKLYAGLPLPKSRASRVEAAQLRAIPLLPMWPGFGINTLFYAAVLWALFAGPGKIRRRLRARRGLCLACAYDLRGRAADSTTCPECGMAVTP